MLFYIIGSLIKTIIGTIILFLNYIYINPFEDPVMGLTFGFLGIFFLSWGLIFFLHLLFDKVVGNERTLQKISQNYKTSLLFSLFILINLGLILIQKWNKILGFVILLIFVFLNILIKND